MSCGPPVRTLSFPISVAFSKGWASCRGVIADSRGIRVGLKVRQTTGTAVELVRGTVILDLELRS